MVESSPESVEPGSTDGEDRSGTDSKPQKGSAMYASTSASSRDSQSYGVRAGSNGVVDAAEAFDAGRDVGRAREQRAVEVVAVALDVAVQDEGSPAVPERVHRKARMVGAHAFGHGVHRVDDTFHAARAEVAERVGARAGLAVAAVVVDVDDVARGIERGREPRVAAARVRRGRA